MIDLIEAKNARGAVLGMNLEDISSGFIVQNVEGLGPVNATLVSSTFGLLDGAQYQSSRREPRNIIMTLGLHPDYIRSTVGSLRSELYSFFMPKSEVTLTFYTDYGLEASITGRVESFETPLFTQEPTVQLSIMCFDPDFYSAETIIHKGVTVDSQVETPLIYPGTIETGAKYIFEANRSGSLFTISNDAPNGSYYSMDLEFEIIAGDKLIVNTSPGSKEVLHVRGANTSLVLYAMEIYSDWIKLWPGENRIRFYTSGAPMPYSVEYSIKYGGL